MMLGAASLSAAIPEHLYMVGEASPSLWYVDIAQEMTNEGDGVFSYRGTLYKQNLQFIDAKNWETGVRYVPEESGWHITEAATATIVSGIGNENRFWVPENGTYEIKVYFGDDGDSVYITGQWVDEMAPMVIPMGASTNQWDTATAHPSYNIYPKEERRIYLYGKGSWIRIRHANISSSSHSRVITGRPGSMCPRNVTITKTPEMILMSNL